MKKIAVGDLGEFWYGDYKEPFEQLEGAVPGYPVGVVLKAVDGKLLCAYCGKTYHNLGAHAAKTHGLQASQYKRETGLLQKSALVSERTRFLNAAHGMRLRAKGVLKKAPTRAEALRASRVAKGQGGTGTRTPESLNKRGQCFEQIKAVGRAILVEKGRITEAEMRRRGIGHLQVTAYFGDWAGFLRSMGDTTAKRAGLRVSSADLVLSLRALAHELGRTPMHSDIRRYGLHSANIYVKRFGSWTAAIEAAGLQPRAIGSWNIRAIGDADASAVLAAYSVSGGIAKVARKLGTQDDEIARILGQFGISATYSTPQRQSQMALAGELAARLGGLA